MSKKYYGEFGGRFVPETFIPVLEELNESFLCFKNSDSFRRDYHKCLSEYAGRPTPLTPAVRLSKMKSCRIYLKREDLLHTGAHKLNNSVGQALLALRMGKKELIAETGAGQHGVSVATVGAYMGLPVKVFMGAEDVKRQALNVYKMKLLGAEVIPVAKGQSTLKDAINEAYRYWTSHVKDSYYLLGSVMGPYPYPEIVKYFQSVIGREVEEQILKAEKRLPDRIVACVGGGSNAMGIFHAFLCNKKVELIGVEAGGRDLKEGEHSATLEKGRCGILHGMKTLLLEDGFGQIKKVHSIAPGLDYPGVGPELAYLARTGRVRAFNATDDEAVRAFRELSAATGIIPALESAHAVAWVLKNRFKKNEIIVINISGRGDKDLYTLKDREGF